MTEDSNVEITIDFRDAGLDSDELEELTQNVFEDFGQLQEIEQVDRIREKPPKGVKAGDDSLGRWLGGIISVKITPPNLATVIKTLFNRLSGKKVKLKGARKFDNGEMKKIEIEITGSSQEEVIDLINVFNKSLSDI